MAKIDFKNLIQVDHLGNAYLFVGRFLTGGAWLLICLALLVSMSACDWQGRQTSPTAEPLPSESLPTASLVKASPTALPQSTWTASALAQPPSLLPTPTRNSSLVGQVFTCLPADQILVGGGEAGKQLPVYRARAVRAYPHDPGAYTQGLIFMDGYLYESTGQYGASSLRKVDLETGEVVQQIELPKAYFGEGISVMGEQIYQLTWQEGVGFVYDAGSFQVEKTFPIPGEGWGLTTDGARLILSDGSSRLFFLDPASLQITGSLAVHDGLSPLERINELEFVNGEVWANIYKTSCIARLDPASGAVLGWIDVSGLLSEEEATQAEVPNGIAYDIQGERIFVTGKWWPRLFEIELERVNGGG